MLIKSIKLIILKVYIVHRRRTKERWMLWRCDLIVGYDIDRMAGSSEAKDGSGEDITVILKKNMLSWLGHV